METFVVLTEKGILEVVASSINTAFEIFQKRGISPFSIKALAAFEKDADKKEWIQSTREEWRVS